LRIRFVRQVATVIGQTDESSMPDPTSSVVVGRERECALLRRVLDDALHERGGVVLVNGEAGIGKTTLVTVLASHAENLGAVVLWGRLVPMASSTASAC
jgi:MoxR-like ATPase